MKYDVYKDLKVTDDFSVIDFISSGPKGDIRKRIIFNETEFPGVFNLAFGDITEDGTIDDNNISNNGDRDKILATVVSVAKDYTIKYPERVISFTGSNYQRTRLYIMAISLNYIELSSEFEIYSYVDGSILPFSENIMAVGFFAKRKKHNFDIMKKSVQINSASRLEITYTVDEMLNKLKGKNLAPKKLAAANKMLRDLKGPFPDTLKPGQPAK